MPCVTTLLLVFLSCFLISSCESTLPEGKQTPSVPTLPLPPTVQQLLQAQASSQDAVLQLLPRKKWPSLPDAPNYFRDLHYDALVVGKQRALRSSYQRIGLPQQQQTKHLDLSYQNIHYLPDYVCSYHDLRYLSLSNNQLQVLNPNLQQCTRLRKLDLSSNGMIQLPQGLEKLHQIEELVLTDNKLHQLPNFLHHLDGLKILDIGNLHPSSALYYNNIQRLPKVLLQMPRLEKLFLDKLPLRSLPRQMGALRELQIVSLNGNRSLNLSQSFQALSTLPNLLALDISFLGRRSLPASIKKLQHLKVLVWHEERQANRAFVENTLRQWLPNTKIYYGKEKVATPFLRGNSMAVLRNL